MSEEAGVEGGCAVTREDRFSTPHDTEVSRPSSASPESPAPQLVFDSHVSHTYHIAVPLNLRPFRFFIYRG
jgi:hypothetical protein